MSDLTDKIKSHKKKVAAAIAGVLVYLAYATEALQFVLDLLGGAPPAP